MTSARSDAVLPCGSVCFCAERAPQPLTKICRSCTCVEMRRTWSPLLSRHTFAVFKMASVVSNAILCCLCSGVNEDKSAVWRHSCLVLASWCWPWELAIRLKTALDCQLQQSYGDEVRIAGHRKNIMSSELQQNHSHLEKMCVERDRDNQNCGDALGHSESSNNLPANAHHHQREAKSSSAGLTSRIKC